MASLSALPVPGADHQEQDRASGDHHGLQPRRQTPLLVEVEQLNDVALERHRRLVGQGDRRHADQVDGCQGQNHRGEDVGYAP